MVTVNLKLDKKTEQVFLNLEKETNIPKEQYITNVINGIDNLDDLKDLNDCLMREKKESKTRAGVSDVKQDKLLFDDANKYIPASSLGLTLESSSSQ